MSNEKTLQRPTKEIPFMHSVTFFTASLKPWLQIIILRNSRSGIEPKPLRTGEELVSRKRGNDQTPNFNTHLIHQTIECAQSLIRKASESRIGPVSDSAFFSNLKLKSQTNAKLSNKTELTSAMFQK